MTDTSNFSGISITDSQSTLRILLNISVSLKHYTSTQGVLKEKENMELKMNEKVTEQFRVVKENSGVNNDQSVIGLLISKEYHRIQRSKKRKVFIPNEDYALIEKAAEARGKTVDEYVQELTEKHFRKVKEDFAPAMKIQA